MNVIENIQGSGGKGGGGGYRAPVEAPNTLQSQQEVTIVEAVSEGPIVGLVNADQSIALDYTPLRTAGGTLTYNGITWGNKNGGPDQEAFPDIAGAEAETSVNVEITKFFPRAVGPDSGAVVRQLSNTNCTHVRITLAVQGLYKQVLDDEERAGDTVGQTLSYSIVIKNVLDEVIVTYVGNRTDKTMSTAQWAHKFKLDGQGPWFVTITKLYDDNENNNIKNDIYWSSFTEIVGYSMIYPHTAVMLVRGSAETFGSSVPSRQYNIKGLVVEVPSNYTVATRTYVGIWDGTFVNAWTDNPAWVLRDVIENDRYGLKKYFAAAVQNVELCDKWTLYEIAKVCDELVPDGYGGTEPRYTFNGQIMGAGEAKEVIQAIASIFHGMTYWGSGKLFAASDFPTDPIRTLNQTQVIEGRLTYSTGSAQELHSVALVTWYDPNDYGRSRLEVVFSWDMFDKVGYRAVQVTAYGCTSRGQAYRQGLWTLLTEEEQWQCSCETGLDTYDLMPGNVIQVADPTMMGIRFSGRYVTISEATITLDAPVILAAGETYTLRLIADDGTEESRVITSRGTSAVITVEEAFTKTFVEHAAWSIAGSDAAPKTFAVRSIKEQETGRLMLSLREVLADKYDRLESSITFTATPGASTLNNVIAAPTGLIVTPTTYITDGGSLMQRLSFSWATVMDIQLSTYEVQYLSPAGDWTVLTGLSTNSVDVTNAILGAWTFKVRAIAVGGRSSAWATTTHTLTGSTTIPMAPTNLTATGWFGDIILTWQIPGDAMYYYSEIYECSTNDLESAVYAARSYGNQFTCHVGSWTGMYYWVRCVGKNGVASDWSTNSGTYGRSEQDSHNDFVDLLLQENPYLTGVQTDLNTAITLVDTNIKTVQTEAETRADADSALSSQITTLQSTVGANTGAIQTEAETRADADTALARFSRNMQAVVDPIAEGLVEDVLNQADARKNAVQQYTMIQQDYNIKIEDGLLSEATARELLAVKLDQAEAAILTEQTARADGDSAVASQVTTLQTTTVGGTVTESASAPSSPTAGQVYYNTTSKKYFRWSGSEWVEVKGVAGHSRSAIQIINESVDGIKGKHAVKIDTNGYVTGYELIGTGASSSMVFHVDNFLIGKPGATNDYPFALGTVDGVTRISMQNVFIQDAAIDTLKIKNNAVTTYVFVTGGQTSSWGAYYGAGTPTWRYLPANNSVTITGVVADRPAMITFSVNWYSAEDYAGTSFRVLANTAPSISGATVIWSKNVGGGDQINMSYTEQFQWIPPSSGTWYLYIQWLLGSGGDYDSKWSTYIRSHSLSLFHMKR